MGAMHAELIAVGAELTNGRTINTNVSYLARRLEELGIPCRRHVTVPDEHAVIVEALAQALSRCRLVVLTGGLGPTVDDITLEAIAQATHRRLVFQPQVAARIRAFCRAHHTRVNRLALRQASLPEGAIALPNSAGTAPGVWFSHGATLLIALPGVPREMRAIMEHEVLPRLRRQTRGTAIRSRTLRTAGIVELDIQTILRSMPIPPSVQFGLYPHLGMVDVRLTATAPHARTAERELQKLERALRRRVGSRLYGVDEETLEHVVGKALVRRGKTLAIAESCTGGLIADRVTNVPGSSRYLLAAVVAYHNRVKESFLGVPPALLSRHGAVSSSVARAMAQGIRRVTGADIGLATTGIAGPDGGTRNKPVGLVYVALADRRRTAVTRLLFPGDRLAVKEYTAQMALAWLRRWVLGLAD